MKKVISFVMALMILASLLGTVFAAEGAFTPSVTAKPAPEVVAKPEAGGNPVVEVVNEKEETVEHFEIAHVEVTPVSEKDEDHVADEVEEVLTDVYEELSAPEVKLTEAIPTLEEAVEKVIAATGTQEAVVANDLVVKDLFHVAVSEELAKVLETEGHGVKLTLDAKIAKNQFVVVLVYVDGEWIPVDFVVNEDGTITCDLEVVGVVAILVKP